MRERGINIWALCLLLLASGCVKRAPRPSSGAEPPPAADDRGKKCGLFCRLEAQLRENARRQAEPKREPHPTTVEPASRAPSRSSHSEGVYHTVKKGETLWRICHTYGADVQEVSRRNGIADPTQIQVGQRILIPGARETMAVTPAPLPENGDDGEWPSRPLPPPPSSLKGTLLCPVPGGQITSHFGDRHGSVHEGLDLSAPAGTPVLAAEDGKVVYSDDGTRGYGNMIIIKHAGNLSTIYAHNSRNLVHVGEMVKRGQKIAEVGATGHATGNHCHFEVRVEEKPVNPEYYLP